MIPIRVFKNQNDQFPPGIVTLNGGFVQGSVPKSPDHSGLGFFSPRWLAFYEGICFHPDGP